MSTLKVIEIYNGSKFWFSNNKRHRTDGPAVECESGTREWWVAGKRHRTDGPSIERANGENYWYINGHNFTFDEWAEVLEYSEQDKLYYLLKYMN